MSAGRMLRDNSRVTDRELASARDTAQRIRGYFTEEPRGRKACDDYVEIVNGMLDARRRRKFKQW